MKGMSTTTITTIKVRDTDTQTDTNITLPLKGGVLQTWQAGFPKNWSLSVYFSSSPIVTSTIYGASFSIDGANTIYQESPPYVVNNKHPGAALNLPAGPHTLVWAADGMIPQNIDFVVETLVPATSNGIIGTNGDGILNDPHYDPSKYAILAATATACDFKVLRLWTEGTIGDPFPSSEWAIPLKWAALGVKMIAVLNFENSKQRCQAPTDADWLATLNSIPPASQTGVWAFEIGNEIDTFGPVTRGDVYWIGTPQQYTHLCALAYPILKAKGYDVIMGNVLRGLTYYETLKPLGAFNYCDWGGVHPYNNSAATNLAFVDQGGTFMESVGKGLCCTESNPRCSAAQAVAQLRLMKAGYLQRKGIFLFFPFVNGGDPQDNFGPINLDMTQSVYFPGLSS